MSKIEEKIVNLIEESIKKSYPDCPAKVLPEVYLEYPKEDRFGDFSTNIAMRLTKELKKSPMDIASNLVKEMGRLKDDIDQIKIEKPGFINFYLSHSSVIGELKDILGQKNKFGCSAIEKGKKVQIEFVSANPTGPLTVAHGRQAAIGDSLARIMEACGYKVTREYYLNDEGVQMNILAKSVRARFLEAIGQGSGFPEDGYKGLYICDIAKGMASRVKKDAPETVFGDYAYKEILGAIKKDLDDFGVHFDVWYSQKKLSKSGKIKKALAILKDKGFLYEKDGATWFASTRFKDDKDRVVIKNDGTYTYLAPDIAYHKEKFGKGYKKVINIWGPDHHGYVNRMKAACQALGFDKDNLSILISQLVTLYRDKKPIKMSTREGEFITLRQVIDEVGKDAGRFFFMMRRTDSHLDFDLELAKSKSMDNPVYYIQYAHARIASIGKFSEGAKCDMKNLHLLDKPEESSLIKKLMRYPKIIQTAANNLEPYVLLSYLQELASLFHSYYNSYRIVTDDKIITGARLTLVKAVKAVLSNGLSLLGVSAPEKM